MPPLHCAVRNRFLRCLIPQFRGFFVVVAILIGFAASASAQIYITNLNTGTVGKYALFTGAPINANFISGLSGPLALTLQNNTLLVGEYFVGGTNRTYDATTGALINPNFLTSSTPTDYEMFGGDIFVANYQAGTISRYNATTGAPVDANFITGVSLDFTFVVAGNYLLVTTKNGSFATVRKYDANTGALIDANFIGGLYDPSDMLVSGNFLYITELNQNRVGKYDVNTGVAINASFLTGFVWATAIAEYGGKLYVSDTGFSGANDVVKQYDAATGTLLNANFITGLDDPYRIVIVPEPGSATLLALAGTAWLGIHRRRRR